MSYPRSVTINGTSSDDTFYTFDKDDDGDGLLSLAENDGTAPPDLVIYAMGEGADYVALGLGGLETTTDHIEIHGGEGNDTLMAFGAPTDQRITIFGQDGDDFIDGIGGAGSVAHGDDGNDTLIAWAQQDGYLFDSISGGAGADEFRLVNFSGNSIGIITDFEVGVDRLMLENQFERFDEITPEMLATPGSLYSAADTADGLLVVGHHLGWSDGEPEQRYAVTLTGVTLAEFMAGTGITTVDGTDARDVIREDYVDADGDRISDRSNLVLAGAGHDTVTLTVRDSIVHAGDGRDFVIIRGGGNTVYGEAGNDYLIARHDGSVLDGGTGDDRLVADIRRGGDHILTGGEGADGFEFLFGATRHAAQTAITDFELGVDSLRVDGVAIDLSDLPDGMMVGTDEDGSIILSVGLNDTLTLRGITETDLTGLLAA